jgi:hypothetical protein
MKTRGVVGKRIMQVTQKRVYNRHVMSMVNAVEAIILEDGTELRPVICEWEGDYSVDFVVVKPPC